eukprot:TRINITY_DN41995_c0_g1_i1.p1 TRINITY_DN41995_c0_g1~~TRINITY_DN41995_c0_g1_i1.p1  ORF type:complete len:575 (+),score=57.04 TRINITY_DN41995_c0_g1_i1:190-1725(+)
MPSSSSCTAVVNLECQRPELDVLVTWVSCFVSDGLASTQGPQSAGYSTETCAAACSGFALMMLTNTGWCSCSNRLASDVLRRPESECGSFCPGEGMLLPARYCGTTNRIAVYSLPRLLVSVFLSIRGIGYNDVVSNNASCVAESSAAIQSLLAVSTAVPHAHIKVELQEATYEGMPGFSVEGTITPPNGMKASAISTALASPSLGSDSVVSLMSPCIQQILGNSTLSVGNLTLGWVGAPIILEESIPLLDVDKTTNVTNATNDTVDTHRVQDLPGESPAPPTYNESTYPGAKYSPRRSFVHLGGNEWSLVAMTGLLSGGRRYRLCTDLDGLDSQNQLVGDTGLAVFVSPITAVEPSSLVAGINTSLVLACERGGCSSFLEGFLAPQCSLQPSDTQRCPAPSMFVNMRHGLSPQDGQADTNSSNASNDSNDTNTSRPVSMPEGGTVVLANTPRAPIVQVAATLYSLQLDLGCMHPGSYRLCLVGTNPDRMESQLVVEDGGFPVEVVVPEQTL